MKKYVSLFLAFVLACSVLPSCSKSTTAELKEGPAMDSDEAPQDELTKKILSDWFDYLFASEQLYGDMLWANTYVDMFREDQTWENLQLARMALWTAERYISQRDKPAASVTTEEYDQLLTQGKDVSFIQPELESFTTDKDTELQTCRLISMGLKSGVFWRHSLNAALTSAELSARRCECELGYLAATTDYLLLTLGESEEIARFDQFISENCPRIAAYRVQGADKDELYNTAAMYLDEIESIAGEAGNSIGQYQASVDLLKDALQTGVPGGFAKGMSDLKNLPDLLPYPDWYIEDAMESFYYWEETDGSHTYPVEGQTLEQPADGFTAQCTGIAKEDFLASLELLEACGTPFEAYQDEGDQLGVVCHLEEAIVEFLWSEDKTYVMIEGNVGFAPTWYISVLAE